jgi:hypothetical protein
MSVNRLLRMATSSIWKASSDDGRPLRRRPLRQNFKIILIVEGSDGGAKAVD